MCEEDIEVYVSKAFLAAKKEIEGGNFSLVVLPESGEPVKCSGKGVRDLLKIYETTPQILKNAVVLDKIIGKAAASILILGGVRAVYAETLSSHGRDFLDAYGVLSAYRKLADRILNRVGDDFCPVEKVTLPAVDASSAFCLMKEFFASQQKDIPK